MEYFWLAVAIGTAGAAAWAVHTYGWQQGRQWLWFPAIALAMFLFRRFTSRRLEAMEERRRNG